MRPRGDARPPACARELAEARRIEREFPGWRVWISSLGRYWAVRQGPDAKYSRGDGRPMTLDADDPAALRAALGVDAERADARAAPGAAGR